MNSSRWRFFFLGGVLALGFMAAQGPDTRLELCHITVQDKSGHPVNDLKEDAFTVFENGVKQDIQFFRHGDIPVSLGLILDNSSSMWVKRSSVEAAGQALVADFHSDDEVFVVNFDKEVYFDNPHGKDFLTDRAEILEALTRFEPRGSSALREAMVQSIDWMKKAHKEKHLLVVVTDGVDNASYVKLDEVTRRAQQSNVAIYAIGLLDEDKSLARDARRQLISLAEATGGEAFFPRELADADRIARQTARDIRSQYTIGYQPSNKLLDGSFRQIKVTVKAAGNPTVRTRAGYYAAHK